MPLLADRALDAALEVIRTELNRVDICTQEPATYTEATSTYTKGNKATGISVGAQGDATPNGRKVTVAAISAGTISGAGTVTHQAGTDVGNTRLLEAGALSASQVVSTGNPWSLAAFDVRIPDAA